jgi:hypothetical protein
MLLKCCDCSKVVKVMTCDTKETIANALNKGRCARAHTCTHMHTHTHESRCSRGTLVLTINSLCFSNAVTVVKSSRS